MAQEPVKLPWWPPRRNWWWWLRAVLAMLAVPAVGWVIWALPMWLLVWGGQREGLTPEQWAKACTDARTLFVQLGGGAGILYGLVLNARSLDETRRHNQNTQEAQAADREQARTAQAADRFDRAIGQLGDSALSVRLGAIYALESLAKDYPEEWWEPAMEIMAAHVRTHRPLQDPDKTGMDPFPEEFQAILDVFGRSERPVCAGKPFGLSRTDLRGARLQGDGWRYLGDEWPGVVLGRSDLRGAVLRGGDLSAADLRGADLRGADLYDADLRRADLSEAVLDGAGLQMARLDRARLGNASLRRCILYATHLVDAWASSADLTEAEVNWATNLRRADLQYANLDGVKCSLLINQQNSYAGGMNLEEADLRGAHLGDADLRGAHLQKAQLAGAVGLTQEQLDTARGTPASLPGGLRPPAHFQTEDADESSTPRLTGNDEDPLSIKVNLEP